MKVWLAVAIHMPESRGNPTPDVVVSKSRSKAIKLLHDKLKATYSNYLGDHEDFEEHENFYIYHPVEVEMESATIFAFKE